MKNRLFQGCWNNIVAELRPIITIITSESRSLRIRRMSFFNSDEFSNSVTQNIYIYETADYMYSAL